MVPHICLLILFIYLFIYFFFKVILWLETIVAEKTPMANWYRQISELLIKYKRRVTIIKYKLRATGI